MPLRRIYPALFLLILLSGCGPKTEEEPTWIGCVAAFTGADASAGARLKQGVALAVDDAAAVRVDGRRLAVVTADDRASDETTQAEAVRLLSVNHVAALIGDVDPGRALRLARAVQPYACPVVLPGEIAGPLPGDAVFTLGVRPGWRGQILARYAGDVLKAKRAFVLTDERDPIAVEAAAGFVEAWPHDEAAALEQATVSSDADWQERTARVAAAKPEVVLIAAAVPDFLKARAQLDAVGPHAPLLYGGADRGAEPFEAAGGDVTMATVVARDELADRGKEFAKKYQDRFHEAPDLSAVEGYDAARLLFDAMARAKTSAADRVRPQLAATTAFESLTGPLRFVDGRARRRMFVVRLRDGEAQVVQTIDPEADAPSR